MKVHIHAKQYWRNQYGIWNNKKNQLEILKKLDHEIELDAFKSSFGNQWQIEINQELHFNQDVIDYFNDHYDEVEIKLISYVTADLSCEKSLKQAIEREKNAVLFFEKQLEIIENER